MSNQRDIIGSLVINDRQLLLMAGSPYQHYLIPIDYLPSRDLRPRWGGTHPPHAGLTALFRRDEGLYTRFISEMQSYATQFSAIPIDAANPANEPGWRAGTMNAMDLAMNYFFVSKFQPKRYVEIGSGVSTIFARRAVSDNALSTHIMSIDPEPRAEVDALCDSVVRDGLETLPSFEIFERLEPGDIVFLDGSHRVFMNSDVTIFMLEVLPRLRPGVLIQIHDIHLPYDYPEMFRTWYWSEQYIIATYLLAAPEKIQILMPCRYVGLEPRLVADLLPPPALASIKDTWQSGGSLWFTKV